MSDADTIFALSSGAPPAAIAIMRISGPKAISTATILAGKLPEARYASLVSLKDPEEGNLLDQALALVFRAPNTATGEDLVELHLHGGRAVIRAVETSLAKIDGLRAAEAGEFTRRAFLNGRIDLNEADALGDLLTAESEWQRRAAATMLGGRFGDKIEAWREEILRLSALLEAELDFSDEDDVDSNKISNISNACDSLRADIDVLLAQPPAEKLHDGLYVVLGGPPNSGKSTLLNALVERDAAIVSDIAGTTRDVIEVPVSLNGVPFVFTDTAGIRSDSGDEIEAIGIQRANDAFERADIILWLGRKGKGPEHSALIEIEAKADDGARMQKDSAIPVSAKTGDGLAELTSKIMARAEELLPPADGFAINKRQRESLSAIVDALEDAAQAQDMLIAAELLRQARLGLDALTGRAHTEDMLDALFGRFCIGK